MVMRLRSAKQYMVLRSGKVLVTPTKSLLKKKTKLMTPRKRMAPARPRAPTPLVFSWAALPAATAQKPTEEMIEDFVATTGGTQAQAESTITRALQLGLTLDHAVEYYLTHSIL